MNTGILSRAHASQIGSSSGSSSLRREPSGFFVDRPKPFADLADANRARGDVGLELRDRLLRPAGSDVLEVDARENAHAVLHLLRCADRSRASS